MLLIFAWSLLAAGPLQATPPSFESIEPLIGERGSELSVVVTGAGLDGFQEAMFYDAGMEVVSHEMLSESELKLGLRIRKECPLGTHYLRIRTDEGISELRAFTVTPFPVLQESRMGEEAQPVDRNATLANVTILGTLEAGQRDRYQANFQKGERVSTEVAAVRLGHLLLDTVLSVYDPNGRLVTTVDDTPLYKQDPFTTFVAEQSGSYTFEVHETSYDGDSRSRYALHLGNFPRPSFLFPGGGKIGEPLSVVLEGDYAGADAINITPTQADLERGLSVEDAGVPTPTAIPFRAVAFGNVMEVEPNDTPELPTTATGSFEPAQIPVAFHGLLERAGDMDCFAFQAVAEQLYVFEAFADRVGSAADTVISIVTRDGEVLVRNDDGFTHDSRLEFRAPETGVYFLHVTDKLANGDWRFVYRVEATRRDPSIIAFLPRPLRRSQEGQNSSVPQGNRSLLKLGVRRTFFDGPVQATLHGLPSGVDHSPIAMESDQFWTPVVVSATSETAIAGGLIGATVTGVTADDQSMSGSFEQIVDVIDGPADAIFHQANLNQLAFAVTRRVPFTVDLVAPATSLPQDGSLALLVRVQRESHFDGEIEISLPTLPPDTHAESKLVVPADKNEIEYTIYSLPNTPLRSWKLCCEAQAAAKSRGSKGMKENAPVASNEAYLSGEDLAGVRVCSTLATLNISPTPIQGKLVQAAGEQGTKVDVVCQLEWQDRSQLPEQLTITLEGLPNRVKAEPVVWTGEKEVHFSLDIDPTAPIGSFDSVYCRMAGSIAGQQVSFHVARDSQLIVSEPGELMRDDNGRALSPLEALRRRSKGE